MSDQNKKEKTPRKHIKLLKRVTIASIALSTLVFGTVSADTKIQTVYHVYIDGQRVGTVDSKNVVEKVVDQKIDSLQDEFQGLSLVADNVSVIEEHAFLPTFNNETTAKKLETEIEIAAEAKAITVDGEPVAYLKNEEDAKEALKQLKLQYVKEEQLQELEARANSEEPLPALAEGQSRLLDVSFNEKVSISDGKVSPEQVHSPADTVTLLNKGTLEEKKYQVKEGDVLGSIAVDHDLETTELLALNPGMKEDTLLQIGQELNVTAYKPFLTVIVKMEQNKKETIKFETKVNENSNMYKGDRKVTQEGQEGEKTVHYEYKMVNGVTAETKKVNEVVVKEPVTEVIEKGTKVVPSRGSGQLAWPTVGGYISSHVGYRWGRLHKGLDIARPSNYAIKAADNGTVVEAGYSGSFGNKVVINHNNGMKTIYAHMSSIQVKVGQTVTKGQQIGVMGSTGNSTGTHLHFELYINGALKNPLDYL
ncbi:peptidoglycan DD-metalloendopeptidase family protein [Bacillus timonensis]|uniref:peptidoglycan DD-metalloendopeptidase family protein n=1 Tax=Bacillus timonensis TaxID=1033734 RepID=UPI0002890E04|nr:M23 family metallopeptidase [Bacillus timonensis]